MFGRFPSRNVALGRKAMKGKKVSLRNTQIAARIYPGERRVLVLMCKRMIEERNN